ncbi:MULTISPECIES: hypothetical protein [unclassified Microbacterium]|uniref:hypothetical protein n=1 Tax=unclassified Microbacterium TaxID=2609290 RepID=UPI000EAAC577|nr:MULTISPECIES: hypothetical protein [unclassified Microbacterium]MBT2484784.1 hypothetical protein [Microbacterium sp. ISL-108]RKN67660.1 hypothetical protein D7252_08730 [Microbacterium sp. CGR2]
MKPLAIVSLTSLLLGLVFLLVSALSWPRGSFLETSQTAAANILGLSIGAGLISLALTAWLLSLHAKEVGSRTFDALEVHASRERDRARRDAQPLSFRG